MATRRWTRNSRARRRRSSWSSFAVIRNFSRGRRRACRCRCISCWATARNALSAWLRQHPAMYIYHYGHYEPTAFKRLMSLHGTREAQVDQFLREARFVDLLRVVREALSTSEPGYSLKNIEHFYMGPREGEVKDAGASIVNYDQWRETQNPELLEAI